MKAGIILVALGYELYGTCALNLAMSIKAYSPEVPILLVHDEGAISHLSKKELSLFDLAKVADPADYAGKQYQRMKLCVDKYSEFENTLYIDVDTIWFPKKKVTDLLEHLCKLEFFIGQNGFYDPKTKQRTSMTYTFWEDPKKICNHFKLQNKLPQTISGVFFFKKGEFSQRIFDRAREIYDDQTAPCMSWAGGKPDEYCFNVALSENNYSQGDSHFVFFDKVNGSLNSKQIYDNFWGLAIGGTKISDMMSRIYNSLVDLYAEVFELTPRYCQDKLGVVTGRS